MTEENYLNIMEDIRTHGSYREGRNGGTYGVFGRQMRFDLTEGFPLLLTKRVHFKSILVELLWFIKGMTNVDYLHKHGVTIWDEWADEDGNLGPVYGAQWRGFGAWNQYGSGAKIPGEGIDQLSQVIQNIKNDPYSRRHIVSAWNPLELYDMALPPCHTMFQFFVDKDELSCHLYQRSADWFLGVPFNIASYALLTHLVARETGLDVGDFVHSFGDAHIYHNHLSAVDEQLSRPYVLDPILPTIEIIGDKSIFDLEPEDIVVHNYNPQSTIKAEVSK